MKNNIHISYHNTKIGQIVIGSFEDKICIVGFQTADKMNEAYKRIRKALSADFVEYEDNVIRLTKQQIEEYLVGSRKEFDIPLLMLGTDFQKKVWRQLLKVPYGQTRSYRDIAKGIGNKGAVRAVGSANGANSIAIIIPCHRIVKSDGSTGGYAGGVDIKKMLLEIERNHVESFIINP